MSTPIRCLAIVVVALAACGDYRTVEAPPPPPVYTPVVGRVIDAGGYPSSGIAVAAGGPAGWGPATTSDPDGWFVLWVTGIPYDLAVLAPGESAHVFLGVWRRDPTVRLDLAHRPPAAPELVRSALIRGTIAAACSGAGCPPAEQGWGMAAFEPGGAAGVGRPAATPIDYAVTAFWLGPDRIRGRFHVLTWAPFPSGAGPLSYWYAGTDVEVSADGTTRLDLAPLQPAATVQLAGAATAPPGGSVARISLFERAGDAPWGWLLWEGAPQGNTFDFPIPSALGLSASILAEGWTASVEWAAAGRSRMAAGATGLELVLHPAPLLGLPEQGAQDVGPETRFAWSPVPGAVSVLRSRFVTVATAGAEIRFPDLRSLGVVLPAGDDDTWSVTADGPYDGLDSYLGPPPASTVDWWRSVSSARTFRYR